MLHPIIIVGSGLAGYNLVREIRHYRKDIPILMITRDAGDFYSKPQLSIALSTNKTPNMLLNMGAENMAAQYAVEILTQTSVEKIIPQEKTIIVNQPEKPSFSLHYSALVLCVGADTHQPNVEGDAAADVLQVNDVYQYERFREKIVGKKNITLLGAGLVGCEFANDLTQAGYEVQIIEPTSTPLAALVPEPIGQQLVLALAKQGAHWHLGNTAKAINHQQERYQITLKDNTLLTTDVVFSAIGLRPRTELAKQAGIHTHRGIVVDKFLCTNALHIYAMGDCAEINGWLLPYVAPIMQASKALAQTLTGQPSPLSLPAMAVNIKTSCYPLAVCRPPFPVVAEWHIEEHDNTLRAYLKDSHNKLFGFILTKEAIKERMELVKSLENWL